MTALFIVLGIAAAAAIAFGVFLLLIRPGKADLSAFDGWMYAHRGLFVPGTDAPENSRAAFRRAVEAGYGIELDVHLSADGQLFVMHDENLDRTAEGTGRIVDQAAATLSSVRLKGTEENIPTFAEVLDIVGGRVPMIIELKTADGNSDALVDAVVAALEGYAGLWCLESFDPRTVRSMKRYPAVIRGQLSGDLHRGGHLPLFLDVIQRNLLFNGGGAPHFVAYDLHDVDRFVGIRLCRSVWKVPTVLWAARTPEELAFCRQKECLTIFEQTALKNGGDGDAQQ